MYLEEDVFFKLAENQLSLFEVKIKNLLDSYYRKPYILDSRVKNINKLKKKQLYLSDIYNYPVELFDIPDIVGFRISVPTEEDVVEVSKIVKDKLLPTRLVDYFNKPRETGFKAFLYYFQDCKINTEIQIMTEEMMEWTNATHEEHNIRKYGK